MISAYAIRGIEIQLSCLPINTLSTCYMIRAYALSSINIQLSCLSINTALNNSYSISAYAINIQYS